VHFFLTVLLGKALLPVSDRNCSPRSGQAWPAHLSAKVTDTIKHAAVLLLQREIPQHINIEAARTAR